jgi:hypothetical protein
MSFFTSPAVQSLLTAVILPLLLTIGAALFQHLQSRLPANVYTYVTQLAESAVAKAEQLSTRISDPISLDDRKQIAVSDIKAILAAHHITVPDQLIDMAIEAAVFGLNKTGLMGGDATIPPDLAPPAPITPDSLPPSPLTNPVEDLPPSAPFTTPLSNPPSQTMTMQLPPTSSMTMTATTSGTPQLAADTPVTVAPGITAQIGGSTTANAAATPPPADPTPPSATSAT